MLEKLPTAVGRALKRVRPGLDALVSHREALRAVPASIALASPQFANGDPLPRACSADVEAPASPALAWRDLPPETQSLILLVEDADSPMPLPLVHAIVWGLSPSVHELPEGALRAGSDHLHGGVMGVSSYLQAAWLPPDPPPGHGPHRYAFQLFALAHEPNLGARAGRRAVIAALADHVLARGLLIGTYRR